MIGKERLSSLTAPEVKTPYLTSQRRRLFSLGGRGTAKSDRSTFFGPTGPGFETAAASKVVLLSPPPCGTG
ncbi:hypothetical protein NPIL_178931 [Nephila pilipes]|uniref:Uncharacterized protein n=1 Tax=Nephila pilipes TaxID=299642 RepID=A0A8X6TG44_NEPPI|nr:hypothetical protein NPIL_178931 [Nephila pilipes]